MVVLVDTNVIIDYYCEREDFFEDAKEVMTLCSEDYVDGYVAFHSLSIIWFVLRKAPEQIRREILMNVCKILNIASANRDEVIRAIQMSDFKDFEDCLQDRCAVSVAADYIVTRNIKDFEFSETKAILPEDFRKLFEDLK